MSSSVVFRRHLSLCSGGDVVYSGPLDVSATLHRIRGNLGPFHAAMWVGLAVALAGAAVATQVRSTPRHETEPLSR